jgi:leucyl aminopeptidase (aminopeptidase T)
MNQILAMRGASKLVRVNARVKPGEKVAIVTDYYKFNVAKMLATAVTAEGAEPVMMVMAPREAHGIEPPATIAAALSAADVIFTPTEKSLGQTVAISEARKKGARIVILSEITEDLLISGPIEADFEAQEPLCKNLADLLTKAKEAKVTSRLGTNITMSIEGRNGRVLSGLIWNPGDFGSPPNIEASICPIEGTAKGVIVIDGSIAGIGKLTSPIKETAENGLVISIEGGAEASTLRETLESAKDGKAYNVAELGIGLNPKSRLTGFLLEDESILGSIHIALGTNIFMGGMVKSLMHIDQIILKPSLWLDNDLIIEEGEIRV